jgi:hypothetical protein
VDQSSQSAHPRVLTASVPLPPPRAPPSHNPGRAKQPHRSTVALGTLAGAAVVQGVVRRALGLSGGRVERR